MKKPVILFALMASCAFAQVQAQTAAEDAAKNVLMRDGTFIASHETFGKYYANGSWHDSTFQNEQEIAEALSPYTTTPEEDMAALLSSNMAGDLNSLAINWGLGTPDPTRFLNDWAISSFDEYAQMNGYPTLAALTEAWTGNPMTPEEFASYMGYVDTSSINWDEVAQNMGGYGSMQEWATANYGQTYDRALTPQQVQEIASRINEVSSDTYTALLNHPATQGDPATLVMLQKGLVQAIKDQALNDWAPGLANDALYDFLGKVAFQTPNPEVFAQMDFSNLDLAGKNLDFIHLKGSNLTGEQINQATSFGGTSFEGVDLTGMDMGNRYFGSNSFKNATGLNAAQLNTSQVSQSDLSGLDLTGWNAPGKNINGVNFSDSIVEPALLNGATSLHNVNLSNVNLTGFTPANKDLTGVNLSNTTGLTAQLLGQSQGLAYVNVVGTGITKAALQAVYEQRGYRMSDPSPSGTVTQTIQQMLDSMTFE